MLRVQRPMPSKTAPTRSRHHQTRRSTISGIRDGARPHQARAFDMREADAIRDGVWRRPAAIKHVLSILTCAIRGRCRARLSRRHQRSWQRRREACAALKNARKFLKIFLGQGESVSSVHMLFLGLYNFTCNSKQKLHIFCLLANSLSQ